MTDLALCQSISPLTASEDRNKYLWLGSKSQGFTIRLSALVTNMPGSCVCLWAYVWKWGLDREPTVDRKTQPYVEEARGSPIFHEPPQNQPQIPHAHIHIHTKLRQISIMAKFLQTSLISFVVPKTHSMHLYILTEINLSIISKVLSGL